jgi:hypothetical protein
MVPENRAVQNTNEILSHHLLYVAEDSEASEMRELYAAKRSTSY